MRYTVREIIEAAKKNGLKHIRGSYYDENEGNGSVGGCILGQAAYNILDGEINEDFGISLANALDVAVPDVEPIKGSFARRGLGSTMIGLNDTKTADGRWRSYSELLTAFEYRARKDLDTIVEIED